MKGAAWSVPVIAAATSVPFAAASTPTLLPCVSHVLINGSNPSPQREQSLTQTLFYSYTDEFGDDHALTAFVEYTSSDGVIRGHQGEPGSGDGGTGDYKTENGVSFIQLRLSNEVGRPPVNGEWVQFKLSFPVPVYNLQFNVEDIDGELPQRKDLVVVTVNGGQNFTAVKGSRLVGSGEYLDPFRRDVPGPNDAQGPDDRVAISSFAGMPVTEMTVWFIAEITEEPDPAQSQHVGISGLTFSSCPPETGGPVN